MDPKHPKKPSSSTPGMNLHVDVKHLGHHLHPKQTDSDLSLPVSEQHSPLAVWLAQSRHDDPWVRFSLKTDSPLKQQCDDKASGPKAGSDSSSSISLSAGVGSSKESSGK